MNIPFAPEIPGRGMTAGLAGYPCFTGCLSAIALAHSST